MGSKDRTKQSIENAFQKLLRQRKFEKITVDMILNEADVSRSTFYRFYKDKYDVMNQIHTAKVKQLVSICSGYEDLFYYLLLYGRDNIKVITKLFSTEGVNSFENFLAQETIKTIREITEKNQDGNGFTADEELQVEILCHGITYIARKWFNEEINQSPRDVAHAIFMLLPEKIRNYWY